MGIAMRPARSPAQAFTWRVEMKQTTEMKPAPVLLAFAALLFLPASPAFGREPELNIKAICNSRALDAKLLQSTSDQSIADCIHDEEAAKGKLGALWESTSATIRKRCQTDARSLGTTSYLDLLTCIQMEEELKSDSKKPR
jgi:hypothetical protein